MCRSLFREDKVSLKIAQNGSFRGFPQKLNRNWRFDTRMRVVLKQFKILVIKRMNVFRIRIEFHLRQPSRLAAELQFCLVKVIGVQMQVAKRVHECSGLQVANLRDHQCQQRIRSEIEGHSQEKIRAALVKLTT